jgi:hypothetical protein
LTLWFSQIPSWASAAIVFAVVNAVALGAMLLGRSWSARLGIAAGPPVVNSWATCVGALCSLLFAFTVVSIWNGAARARSNVDDEAAAVRSVVRDIVPSQLPMLGQYVKGTLSEWHRLCGGEPDTALDDQLARIESLAKPRTPAYADDLYRQLATLEDMRNRRWLSATASVPDQLWIALIVLAGSMVCVLALAQPERIETHVALMIAVATALAVLFWVGTVLEYPFCGAKSLGPDELISIARAHLF